MVRSSVALLLVGLLVVGGCKKKNEDGQEGASSGGGTGAAATGTAATNSGAGAKAVDWAKVERVPFATLQTILPESLPENLKRTDLGGSTNPDGEHTYTEATAAYEGPKESVLNIRVHDNPLQAKDLIASKTSAFKGHPIVSESEGQGFADLQFVVGERFVVTVHGQELKVAQLKTALEKVDLTKLASWKDQGLAK
jgi:hypothetical protein